MLQSPDARFSWGTYRKATTGGVVFASLVLSIFAFMFAATQAASPCASAQTTSCTVGIDEAFSGGITLADGGTVTQLTGKSTGVTLNTHSGQITMHTGSLAAGVEVSFVLTNSNIDTEDVLIVNVADVGTAAAYIPYVSAVGNGTAVIAISNTSGSPLAEAIVLNFVLIKGSSS